MKKRIMKKKIKKKLNFGKKGYANTSNVYNNTDLVIASNGKREALNITNNKIELIELGSVYSASMYDGWTGEYIWGYSIKEKYNAIFNGIKFEYRDKILLEIEYYSDMDYDTLETKDFYIENIQSNGLDVDKYMNGTKLYKRYLETGGN